MAASELNRAWNAQRTARYIKWRWNDYFPCLPAEPLKAKREKRRLAKRLHSKALRRLSKAIAGEQL